MDFLRENPKEIKLADEENKHYKEDELLDIQLIGKDLNAVQPEGSFQFCKVISDNSFLFFNHKQVYKMGTK